MRGKASWPPEPKPLRTVSPGVRNHEGAREAGLWGEASCQGNASALGSLLSDKTGGVL